MSSWGSIAGGIIGGAADGLKTGMSMYGASKANKTMQNAISAQTMIQQMAAAEQQKKDQTMRDRYAPYAEQGAQGLGQMSNYQGQMGNFDLQQGVGPQVSYDAEYTNKLKDYEQSPAFQAQNALAQQDLARQQGARGIYHGASAGNASSELSQKLRATDFDKYRSDLAQRYGALQGEYGQRQNINANKYTQLMDQYKMGQNQAGIGMNATNALTGVDQGANKMYQDSMSGLASSAMQSGMQKAQYQTGLAQGVGKMLTLGSSQISSMMGGMGGSSGGSSGGGSQ